MSSGQGGVGTKGRGAFADPNFRRLWAAFSLAQVGSSFGTVAIPLIAIRELGLDEAAMSLLATAAALTLLVASLPAGYVAEFRRKRPIMVTADLTRAASFIAVLALLLTHTLSMGYLVLAMAVNAAMQILFGAASSAHTKDLLESPVRADGLGKLQSAAWVAMILGPAAAGIVAGAASPAALLAVNAATFIVSATLVRSIERPETPAQPRPDGARRLAVAIEGARYLLTQPLLRRLFISWLLFAGAVAAMTPVTQVFYLQDLAFTPQQYGLLLGIPSIGGLMGAWFTGRITRRWGTRRTVWWGSVLRTPWYLLFPLASGNTAGLSLLIVAFTAILLFSSITNSATTALRMDSTPDHLMSRTSATWALATMGAGPAFIPLIGLLMHYQDARTALWAIAALVAVAAAVLPTRALLRP